MPEPTLADVLSAISGIKSSVDELSSRLVAVEEEVQLQKDATPQIIDGDKSGMFDGLQSVGDETAGTLRQKVVGSDGLPRPARENIMGKGTRVRLSPEGETYKVLTSKGMKPERLTGTVQGLHFVTDADEPKYRVTFTGLTSKRGDGFYAHELAQV
jgi:hypothetical protein